MIQIVNSTLIHLPTSRAEFFYRLHQWVGRFILFHFSPTFIASQNESRYGCIHELIKILDISSPHFAQNDNFKLWSYIVLFVMTWNGINFHYSWCADKYLSGTIYCLCIDILQSARRHCAFNASIATFETFLCICTLVHPANTNANGLDPSFFQPSKSHQYSLDRQAHSNSLWNFSFTSFFPYFWIFIDRKWFVMLRFPFLSFPPHRHSFRYSWWQSSMFSINWNDFFFLFSFQSIESEHAVDCSQYLLS